MASKETTLIHNVSCRLKMVVVLKLLKRIWLALEKAIVIGLLLVSKSGPHFF